MDSMDAAGWGAGAGAVEGMQMNGIGPAVGKSDLASESKRARRRYDMVERVERLRRDTIDRKDAIFQDLQQSFSLSLAAMLQQPHPSHPEYLLRLHALSVQRDADLLAARLESTYALETARQLYHNEVDRVEEEYEAAKKAIKDKLLEACDERAKKLREEKDNLEVSGLGLDTMFGELGNNGKHATRRSRTTASLAGPSTNGMTLVSPGSHGNGSSLDSGIAISGISLRGLDSNVSAEPTLLQSAAMAASSSVNGQPSQQQANLAQSHISDPFNYSLLPSSPALGNNALHPSMLLLQPNSSALLQSLKTGNVYHHHRTTGGRTKAGYPPNGIVIPPGTYAVLGKSITALNSLKAEEVADDLEGMRVKRKRGGENRGFTQKKAALHDVF